LPRATSSTTAARRSPCCSPCSTIASDASSKRVGSPEDPITLAELADEFGVSHERLHQIDANSFEKVQKAVKNRIAAIETPSPLPVH
jgi:hypothetical protein